MDSRSSTAPLIVPNCGTCPSYPANQAVRALGLITGNVEAEKAAVSALEDKKPNVRMAAASALGSMQAKHANVELERALQDSEPAVVLAAANSLFLLHDDVGYDIYYDVFDRRKAREQGTGQRRTQHIQTGKTSAEPVKP